MEALVMRKGSLVLVVMVVALLNSAVGVLHKVGGKAGWSPTGVNYTEWAAHRHFYVGEWLYFVFDKHYYNVLEVNKTNYEQCNDQNFIKNITRGGRDVFNLTEARAYYFISSGGYCFHGMKLAINVVEAPLPATPPSAASLASNHSPKFPRNQIIKPIMLLIIMVFTFLFKKW